jgi:acetyl esterase/lipase
MLAPWLDLTMENPEIVSLEKRDPMLNLKTVKKAAMSYAADSNSLRNPYVSPIFGNLEQLAPMSIFIGGRDVLKADTDKFREKCMAAGMPINYYFYPKMMHVWMLAPFLPESEKAFLQIGKLLETKPKAISHEER